MENERIENLVCMEKSEPKRRFVRSDGALYVLLLMAVIGIIVAGNALSDRWQLPRLFVQLSLYAILLAIGWLVYRYCLVSFRYTLTQRMFRVERIVGRKERAEENVHLSDIAWIRLAADPACDIRRARRVYTGKRKNTLAVGIRAAKQYTLLISPSDELKEKLIRQWKIARK